MNPGILRIVLVMTLSAASLRAATEGIQEYSAAIPSTGVNLAGSWLFPDDQTAVPCVVIAGGTMSHTRDGALIGAGAVGAQRDALLRLGQRLAAAGYASLRWDKRGFGETPAGDQPLDDKLETDDLIAALQAARAHPRVTHIIVAGESAGGYFACLAAQRGQHADGYIFLAALASPVDAMFAHNYERLAVWAARDPANRAWAEAHALWSLARGEENREMFRAAQRNEHSFTFRYGEKTFPYDLGRVRYQLAHPPGALFTQITRPALALQGAEDMNVPPGDAEKIAEIIRTTGNDDVTFVNIPGVDHSFQFVAEDPDQRMRDRHAFTSFFRPYASELYSEVIGWLNRKFPTAAAPQPAARRPRPGVVHWDGIQVIDDVTDAVRNPGVETLEGRIGPLMHAEGGQCHYIDMPAGLYVDEHPHASESLIYTVRGQWVLCSRGVRRLMKPGSLYWFQAGAPTGYEVPFDEDAFILIFKTSASRNCDADADFWRYLLGKQHEWPHQQEHGRHFRLAELPPEHPARRFARELNPQWEKKLPVPSAGEDH